MPMGWVALAGVAGSVIGGISANDAANTQANAANNATQAQLGMFQQTRTDLAPYMQQGRVGLDSLNKLLADPSFVTKLPGYQFQLQQGQDAILHSAAASGLTGNTLKALSDYGQGTAAGYYNNYWNQAMQMANLGQTSAAGVGNIGASVGNAIGANMIGAGNALAAGQVGVGNAISGGINGAANNWLLAKYLQQPNGTAYSGGGVGTGGYYDYGAGTSYNNPSAYVGP